MNQYNPKEIEERWQKEWEKQGLYKTPEDVTAKNKMYILPQLPYPSGSGLHVGHAEVYTACDIYARYQRMIGKKVLQVIGWDSFGLPAENYAIKTNVHPKKSTNDAIDNFRSQIKALGISVDWDREVGSHNPDYYKFTQWFFLLMYKRGLAYRKKQSVNWCDSCKTVLANEQVVEQRSTNNQQRTLVNVCERCETEVVQREMEQWYLKITDYADRLIEGLDRIDWPEETKKRQKDWIGRSEGALVCFNVVNVQDVQNDEKEQVKRSHKRSDTTLRTLEVFTTRPDTLFGATYMVVAPEHDLVHYVCRQTGSSEFIANRKEVEEYVEEAKKKTDMDRQTQKEKTGVELKGIKAINPVNNEEIPIFVADYVLASYGTGAIMAVPAHDERDFEFAKKYGLEIKEVVAKKFGEEKEAIRRDGVAGVVVKDKKVLVLYNKKFDVYRLPSGGYEEGEKAEEVIKREMAEETGYTDFVIKDYLGMIRSNNYIVEKKKQTIKFHKGFLLELLSDKKDKTAFEEHEDYEEKWMTKDEAIEKLGSYGGGEEEFVKRAFDKSLRCFADDGMAVNSDFLDGLDTKEAIKKSIEHLEQLNIGTKKVQYKLRDWSVSRQRFWGAPIPMIYNEQRATNNKQYIFIHGRGGSVSVDFWPWLKKELEDKGHTVIAFDHEAAGVNADKSAALFLDKVNFDEDTVVVAHSHGGPVAFRILENINKKISKFVLVDTVLKPEFNDKRREDVEKSTNWKFDFEKIKKMSDEVVVIGDVDHPIIPEEQIEEQARLLGARLVWSKAVEPHFNADVEEVILEESIVSGFLPVSENNLPVLLPDDVDFKPTGESPLNYSESFAKDAEKKYGKDWKYEPDTLDTFMCSSWYYYRYLDPKNENEFASPEVLKKWMPVDFYLGGEEHVNGHLLYSRFFTKVLYDAGFVSFDEPFTKHRHQGLILGEDHQKMSKRWGNVVNPTDVINEFGADTLRMYEMFMGPLEQTKPWDTNGVKGIRRFLEKVWGLQYKVESRKEKGGVEKLINKTVKKVTEDVEEMKFNTAIAKMMELVNATQKEENISQEHFEIFLKMLTPFAPHMAEELWSQLGHKKTITLEPWPKYDESKIVEDKINLVVQVNGKVRANMEVDSDISEDEVKKIALENEKIVKWLDDKEPKKVIFVKGKLVSIVV